MVGVGCTEGTWRLPARGIHAYQGSFSSFPPDHYKSSLKCASNDTHVLSYVFDEMGIQNQALEQ